MVDPIQTLLAVAAAEVRSARRLVRTWVFAVLAIGLTLALFVFYSFVEALYSTTLPGRLTTRFLVGEIGTYLLTMVVLGAVFLGFDLRSRHERDRIAEALDARPFSNVALIAGQVGGLVLTTWGTVVIALGLVQALGASARALGWWMGEPVEPVSLTALAVIDALPTLVLWCSAVTLLAVVLRNRLLVALTALVTLAVLVWCVPGIPVYLVGALAPVSAYAMPASDLAPRLASLESLVLRGSMLTVAVALIVLAAIAYPRRDGPRRWRLAIAGIVLGTVGGIGILFLVGRAVDGIELRETWLAVHTEAAAGEAHTRPDIEAIEGRVFIEPGRRLDVDLTLTLRATGHLTSLVFSFNPGMRVTAVHLAGIGTRFTHRHGLLTVPLETAMPTHARVELSVHAVGKPDPRFAYLDGVVDPERVPVGARINALGREASIFEETYVGLLPAVHWLPAAGANVYRDDQALRPRDFFAVDLTVDVPEDWLVASTGRRRRTDDGSFHFRPVNPVPELGLFASRFVRHAIGVGGVEFELLLHPGHLRNVELFAGVGDVLTAFLEETLARVEKLGVGYPFEGFSVVEVPRRLRGYRGGWLMDTEISPPGLLLLKETGFPNVRFEHRFLEGLRDRADDVDADHRWEWWLAVALGSDLQRTFSRNLVALTGARGEGAAALDFVCQELAASLLAGGHTQYLEMAYSANNHDGERNPGSAFAGALAYLAGDHGTLLGQSEPFVGRPQVWERVLEKSLADLEPDRDPKDAVEGLSLKGTRIAHAILGRFGSDRTGALLAGLRDGFKGESYGWEEFAAVGVRTGAPVASLLGDWLHTVAAPGFVASAADVVRLVDDASGERRYRTRVRLRNDEPAPGAVFISTDRHAWYGGSETFPIDARSSVEIAIVTSEPPSQLWLHSYFSLNRQPIRLDLPAEVDHSAAEPETFVGARPSEWLPPQLEGIVVDDLDPGFAVEGDPPGRGIWHRFSPELSYDRGLPEHWWYLEGKLDGAWFRAEVPSSWGKYRRTMAQAVPGDGNRRAVFTADLPSRAGWRLDFHVPDDPLPDFPGDTFADFVDPPFTDQLGGYDMWLRTVSGDRVIEFDGSGAIPGWNKIGLFELDPGPVSVVVSNRTTGDIVIADAIRWLPEPRPRPRPNVDNRTD